MKSTVEIKTGSKWTMIKTTIEGITSFSFKSEGKNLVVNNETTFIDASPVVGGLGAVAIKVAKGKSVITKWFAFNENGKVVESFSNKKAMEFYLNQTRQKQEPELIIL